MSNMTGSAIINGQNNDRAYTVANAEIRPIDNNIVMDVDFNSTDGEATLDAYFIPAHGEVADLAETTIVYNHGRYASIDHYMPRIQMLHELGVNVYVWDYQGYGKSLPETAPDSQDWMDDASTALEEVKALAPNPDQIVLYGMSVGGYPSGEMARQNQNCALILEAAVLSVSRKNRGQSLHFTSGLFPNLRVVGARSLTEGDHQTCPRYARE